MSQYDSNTVSDSEKRGEGFHFGTHNEEVKLGKMYSFVLLN